MQLSVQDIKRLERLGYNRKEFTIMKKGFRSLRNLNDVCFFFDPESKHCKVYANRPEGCRFYPIVYSLSDKKPIIDNEVCRNTSTITISELERASPDLTRLIKRIIEESRRRDEK